MTPEYLAGLVAAILSILMEWVPGFYSWWNAFDESKRRLLSLAIFGLVGVAIYGLSCVGYAEVVGVPILACTNEGLIQLVRIIFASIISSQSVHLLTKRAG